MEKTRAERILIPVLDGILTWTLRKPRVTLAVACLLALTSWVYTVRNLDFLTGQNDLISPEHPLVQLARELKPLDDRDDFVVVIRGRDREQSLAFLEVLTARLSEEPDTYADLFYRVDPGSFRPWSLLYLDRDELARLTENLLDRRTSIEDLRSSPNLNTVFELINREVTSAMIGELFTGFLYEPDTKDTADNLPELSFLIGVLEAFRAALDGDLTQEVPWESWLSAEWNEVESGGYFWTEDDSLVLMVTPRRLEKSFNATGRALKHLRETIRGVQGRFPELSVGVTGREALGADEMNVALDDMSVATVLSLGALTVLLMVFWRGVRRPLLEMAELTLALSWTFGTATLLVGHLNILSVVFAPLLLGLGIDYGIHWLARFEEELSDARDRTLEEMVRCTHREVGPGIVLSGLCASLSFLPLMLTGFRGLVELGIITGAGMILTTLSTTCVLPSLVMCFGQGKPPTRTRSNAGKSGGLLFETGTSRIVLCVSAVALAAGLWTLPSTRFDLNVLRMQPDEAESVVWEHKLMDGTARSALSAAVLANSPEEMREMTGRFQELSGVAEVLNVLEFIPGSQEEKRSVIGRLETMSPLFAEFHAHGNMDAALLNQTLGRIRFKLDSPSADEEDPEIRGQRMRAANLLGSIRHRLDSEESGVLSEKLQEFERRLFSGLSEKLDHIQANLQSGSMTWQDLPHELIDRYVLPGPRFLIKIYPEGNVWETDALSAFVRGLQTVDPHVGGDAATLYVFTKAFREACIRAAFYAAAAIAFFLFVSFRSAGIVLLAFVPLLVGTVWMVGLMRVFQVDFNLANSLFLPLIVGAGVEYGIIVILRWRESGGGRLPLSAVKGVTLAALTTAVGFGTLMISAHNGIHSLGILATLGSLSILGSAVLVLPALIREWDHQKRHDSDR